MQRLPLRRMIAAVLLLSVVSAAAVVFALAVGASQPGPELTPVLGEPPCAAPCWYAIHPGETDLIEAAAVLDNNPAVEALVINVRSASWWWNGEQPAIFGNRPRPFDGRILFENNAPGSPVQGVALMTTLNLGDLYLALGAPQSQTFHLPPGNTRPGVIYEAEYDGLSVFASLTCPISPNDFWNAEAGITYGEVDLSLGGVRVSSAGISGWPMRRFASLCAP